MSEIGPDESGTHSVHVDILRPQFPVGSHVPAVGEHDLRCARASRSSLDRCRSSANNSRSRSEFGPSNPAARLPVRSSNAMEPSVLRHLSTMSSRNLRSSAERPCITALPTLCTCMAVGYAHDVSTDHALSPRVDSSKWPLRADCRSVCRPSPAMYGVRVVCALQT